MKRMTHLIRTAIVVTALSLSTACGGTFDLQIETTPGHEATIAALEADYADLATQVVAIAEPTPVSSHGRLAYVRGGDVWVKDLPEGTARRLTTGGHNSHPRWSPTGVWLSFQQGELGQVWVMHAGNGVIGEDEPRAVNDGRPVDTIAWSPVEDALAYVDTAQGELRLEAIGPEPSTVVTLIANMPPRPTSPPTQTLDIQAIAWHPDGSQIAYTVSHRAQTPEQIGPASYQGLWIIPTAGGEPEELYASGVPERGTVELYGWTADGTHLLFWQGDILSASMLADGVPFYALPAGGGDPIELAGEVLYYDAFVAPAPTGTGVAMVEGAGRQTWTRKVLRVVEIRDASVAVQAPTTTSNFAVAAPAWSPDGSSIAYVAMPDKGDIWGGDPALEGLMERRLWVINTTGFDPHPLTDDTAYRDESPRWSADGTHLLFVRMDGTGVASLWWLATAGGTPVQVVDEIGPIPGLADPRFGIYGHVTWEPLFDWWQDSAGAVTATEP